MRLLIIPLIFMINFAIAEIYDTAYTYDSIRKVISLESDNVNKNLKTEIDNFLNEAENISGNNKDIYSKERLDDVKNKLYQDLSEFKKNTNRIENILLEDNGDDEDKDE